MYKQTEVQGHLIQAELQALLQRKYSICGNNWVCTSQRAWKSIFIMTTFICWKEFGVSTPLLFHFYFLSACFWDIFFRAMLLLKWEDLRSGAWQAWSPEEFLTAAVFWWTKVSNQMKDSLKLILYLSLSFQWRYPVIMYLVYRTCVHLHRQWFMYWTKFKFCINHFAYKKTNKKLYFG